MARIVWISCRSLFLVLLLGDIGYGGQDARWLGVGRRFASERVRYVDDVTGREVTMLTSCPARDNKIYQTHPNWAGMASTWFSCPIERGPISTSRCQRRRVFSRN